MQVIEHHVHDDSRHGNVQPNRVNDPRESLMLVKIPL